jgi:Holliday junction resolvasome RuvABC endonuclease subunit
MTRYVVGVDPGRDSGVAVVTVEHSPRLISAEQVQVPGDMSPLAVLADVRYALGVGADVICAIEDQYVAKNVHSAIILARCAGRWEEAACAADMSVVYIAAQTWQCAELGTRRVARRVQRKSASRVKAGAVWRGTIWSEHTADAALLARYAAIRAALAAKGE